MWFINFIYWLQAFTCPLLLIGIPGSLIDHKWAAPAFIIGGVIGIIFAEYIRRNIGLSSFFGRIYGPNDWDERMRKKKDLEP